MTKEELLKNYKSNNYSVDKDLNAQIRESVSRNPVKDAMQKTDRQMGDIKSAKETGASFPAEAGESPVNAGLKAIGNLPSSSIGLIKNIVNAAKHPVDLVVGLKDLLVGGGQKIQEKLSQGVDKIAGTEGFGAPEKGKEQQTFDAVVSSLKDRYGSLDNLQRTATNDPVGFGSDILALFTGGAGTVGKLEKLTEVVDTGIDVSKATVMRPLAEKLDSVAVSQMDKALNLNPTDIRRIKLPNVAGETPSEWVLRRGFSGSQEKIVEDLAEYSRGTKDAVDEGLAKIDTRLIKEEAKPATDILGVLKETFDGTTGNDAIMKRIDSLAAQPDYDLSELNQIKRLVDSELQIFKSTGGVKDSAVSKGLFNLRDDLKTLIEDKAADETFAGENVFKDVRDLNKETQVATEIRKSLAKRIDVNSKNFELGLRDAIIGVGGFAAGDPTFGVLTVIGKKAIESPTFRTWFANRIKSADKNVQKELIDAVESNNTTLLTNFLVSSVNEFEKANPSQEESGQNQSKQ